MSKNISVQVLNAIERAPSGISNLELLNSLRLCDVNTLKTTLSRLNKARRIIRLKRGLYSAKPPKDAFTVGQALFGGYLGFTSALYLHKMISEVPFSVTVVTVNTSGSKTIGAYEFRAVALHDKAVGFQQIENYIVSTKAKTLFDCVYLQKYSVEAKKLLNAFKDAHLSRIEWQEYDTYVNRFISTKKRDKFLKMKKIIRG